VNEFACNVERHRRQLQVHCYHMLGSLTDAEDAHSTPFNSRLLRAVMRFQCQAAVGSR